MTLYDDPASRAHAWRTRVRLAQEREAMAHRDADRHTDNAAAMNMLPPDPWAADLKLRLADVKRAEAEAYGVYIEQASTALAQAEAEQTATVTAITDRALRRARYDDTGDVA